MKGNCKMQQKRSPDIVTSFYNVEFMLNSTIHTTYVHIFRDSLMSFHFKHRNLLLLTQMMKYLYNVRDFFFFFLLICATQRIEHILLNSGGGHDDIKNFEVLCNSISNFTNTVMKRTVIAGMCKNHGCNPKLLWCHIYKWCK